MQVTQLIVPADSTDPAAKSPQDGYWQYIFWENPAHLLAWYNGVIGKTDQMAGLYRYGVTGGSLTRVIPLSALGVAKLFDAQSNTPLMHKISYGDEMNVTRFMDGS